MIAFGEAMEGESDSGKENVDEEKILKEKITQKFQGKKGRKKMLGGRGMKMLGNNKKEKTKCMQR